jgi:hypothetical protein
MISQQALSHSGLTFNYSRDYKLQTLSYFLLCNYIKNDDSGTKGLVKWGNR